MSFFSKKYFQNTFLPIIKIAEVQWKVAASHHRQNLIVAFVECLKNVNMDSSSGILECVCFFPFNFYCQTWFSVRRHRVISYFYLYFSGITLENKE